MQIKDIYQNPGKVKKQLKESISPEDIDFLVDTIVKLCEQNKEVKDKCGEVIGLYKKIYMQHHNIPENALITWKI